MPPAVRPGQEMSSRVSGNGVADELHWKAELADLRRPVWLRSSKPVREQGGHAFGSMEGFSIEISERGKVQPSAEGIQRFAGGFPKKTSTKLKKTRFTQRGDRVSQESSSMKTGHS